MRTITVTIHERPRGQRFRWWWMRQTNRVMPPAMLERRTARWYAKGCP